MAKSILSKLYWFCESLEMYCKLSRLSSLFRFCTGLHTDISGTGLDRGAG